jgi:hypothetical protein
VLIGLVAALLASASVTTGQPSTVDLTVQVGLRSPNGARVAADESGSVPVPPVVPVQGVEVRAVAAGGSINAPAGSALTDDEGTASLSLPPGVYWVFVARTDPPGSGPLGSTLSRPLPDGTLTPAWDTVDLSDGSPATTLLVATQLTP